MPGLDDLVMRSNVARDVLSTAQQFGSVQKMLPEYVTNATDNPNDDQQGVRVEILRRAQAHGRHRIVIQDDARGMSAEDLHLFFTMHAENQARRRGQRARGKFGTGKAAAFGVGATALQVTTCRNGRRSEVRLERSELEAAASGEPPTTADSARR
jgi:DNA topoisomerase VI subunit B